MVIAMMAGFFIVLGPPALNELATAQPDIRWQGAYLSAFLLSPRMQSRPLASLYQTLSARVASVFGLSRGAWLFLFGVAYAIGLAIGIGGYISAKSP
jgi:hypothetical protein